MWSGSIDPAKDSLADQSRGMRTHNSAQEPLLAPAGSEQESLLYQSVDMSGFTRKPPPVRSTSARDLPAYITQRQSPLSRAPVAEDWRTIVDPSHPLRLRVIKQGWTLDMGMYLRSPFHTLLHMPVIRFHVVFFLSYIIFYGCFALVYLVMSNECIEGISQFDHAFFFSVQTAATIGYGGQLTPDPDCVKINALITFQTICSLMLDYTMLGLVYARFSSPVLRSWSIRFSKNLFMHIADEKLMLSLRVGNVRSKTFLNPSARLVLAMEVEEHHQHTHHPEDGKPLCLVDLHAKMSEEALACLSLGLPATVSHIIDEKSPLANLSIQKMASRRMEIVAMLDATDSMTSQTIEARHSYQASDIVLNSMPLLLRRRNNGQLVVDYTCFVQRTEDDADQAATNGGNLSPDRCATSMCMDSPDAARAFAEQVSSDQVAHFMDALPCGSTGEDHLSSSLHKSDGMMMGMSASGPLGQDSGEAPVPFSGMEKEGSVDAFAQWRLEGGHSLMDLDTMPVPGSHAHDPDDRRRSMSDNRHAIRSNSFAQIRRQLANTSGMSSRGFSDRMSSPVAARFRPDGAAAMPSAFGMPSPTGDRRPVDRSMTFSSANIVGSSMGVSHPMPTMAPARTAPVDGVPYGGSLGAQMGLGVVPEDSGMHIAPPSPQQSEGFTNREWASKVMNLCNAVVHDQNADVFTKDTAMLLRCEAHEQLLNL